MNYRFKKCLCICISVLGVLLYLLLYSPKRYKFQEPQLHRDRANHHDYPHLYSRHKDDILNHYHNISNFEGNYEDYYHIMFVYNVYAGKEYMERTFSRCISSLANKTDIKLAIHLVSDQESFNHALGVLKEIVYLKAYYQVFHCNVYIFSNL